jgi:hypothetical protein
MIHGMKYCHSCDHSLISGIIIGKGLCHEMNIFEGL